MCFAIKNEGGKHGLDKKKLNGILKIIQRNDPEFKDWLEHDKKS